MSLKVLSLFSGVGGFDLGLENAGMETVYQCEIDKHCQKILKKHWPIVPKWDDITTLTGKQILENAPVIDVVAWGSPCQDLSIAGNRAGLSGEKSSLFYEGIRIINELRKETNGKYPTISIWENVVGALNSNGGNDFGLILDEMAKSGALVIEWGILDAQNFGIPQKRRRVFVIAIFDSRIAERCPDPLLPLGESLLRDTKTSRKTKQNTPEQIKNGSTDTSFTGSSYGNYSPGVGTIRSNGGDLGGGSETLIVELPIVFSDDRPIGPVIHDKTISTLLSFMGTGGNNTPLLAFDTQFGSNANVTENISPTLKATQAPPSVAYSIRIVTPTLNIFENNSDTRATVAIVEPTVFQPGAMVRLGGGIFEGIAPTLRPEARGGDNQPHLLLENKEPSMQVRRLTPKECERLMGWPDDHTRYRADGTEQTDGHRYKQCGNGVASPVATWIGQQITKAIGNL